MKLNSNSMHIYANNPIFKVDSGKSTWIPVNLVDFGKSCDRINMDFDLNANISNN